jgi:hypothetical protein
MHHPLYLLAGVVFGLIFAGGSFLGTKVNVRSFLPPARTDVGQAQREIALTNNKRRTDTAARWFAGGGVIIGSAVGLFLSLH